MTYFSAFINVMKGINDRRNALFLTSNKSFFIKEMDISAGSDKVIWLSVKWSQRNF